jgi:hypothetical protein
MVAASVVLAVCPLKLLLAQDLAPRAYIIAPVHSNVAVTSTYSFLDGDILFDSTLPITGSKNEAIARHGGNFQNVSVAWQYSWLGRPN